MMETMKSVNFEKALTELLNTHSIEGRSDTPNFILAKYMLSALTAFELAAQERDRFWNHQPRRIPDLITYDGKQGKESPSEVDANLTKREAQRRNEAQWARTLIEIGEFVVLDTETTGLNRSRKDEPCQIAIVAADGTVLIDTLVKPSIAIDPGAAAVHGITDAGVADAPTLQSLYDLVQTVCKGKVIVVYNEAFDRPVICNALGLNAQGRPFAHSWQCAMLHYADFAGEWNDYRQNNGWHKLGDACVAMGLSFVGTAHSALGDAQAALGLIHAMATWEPVAVAHEDTLIS